MLMAMVTVEEHMYLCLRGYWMCLIKIIKMGLVKS